MIVEPDWRPSSQCTFDLPRPGALHLWLIGLERENGELPSLLSQGEQGRAARYLSPSETRRFTLARSGMRWILGAYLGIQGAAIAFRYGRLGKPALPPPHAGLEFNLSHSGDRALLALTRKGPVGIDLEPLRPRANARQIARKVFSEALFYEIADLPDGEFHSVFLQHWTALEARVKCQGKGVFGQPDDAIPVASFRPATGTIAAVAMARGIPPVGEWQTFELNAAGC